MLKALVKKQFMELFQSFFLNRKNGRARSRGAIIGIIAGFAILMLFLCAVFAVLAFGMGADLLGQGQDWLYFSLFSLIAMFMGVFGSVFNTYSSLYAAKDNDLLLAMPIPPRKLLASRLIGVYALGLMYEAEVMLPTIIIYWILVPVNAARILCPIGLTLVLSLFVLSLCCILGWVVALISARLKNKSFITVFVSLVFFALYYFFIIKVNTSLREIAKHTEEIARAMKSWLYPFYQMGLAGAGSALSLLILALIAAALFAVIYFVLSRTFLRIVTVNRGEKKAVYREKPVKTAGMKSALLRREFKRFTANATYMLNCGLGLVMMLGIAVLVVIKAAQIRPVLSRLLLENPSFAPLLPVILAGLAVSIVGMNAITAPSVSLEGKSLWLIQSMPVRARDVLDAKQMMHLVLVLPLTILMSLCLCLVAQMPIAQSVLFIAICALAVCLSSAGGLALNLLRPNLNWTSEGVPIKQSMPVFIALFGFWALATAIIVPYIFLGKVLRPELYLGIWCIVLGLSVALINLWIARRGAAIFENL